MAGVNNGRGVLFGLHPARDFEVTPFNPALVGGVDSTIFDYLHAQLRGLLVTPRDALDFLLLSGDIYSLVFLGLPRSATAVRIAGEADPVFIEDAEIEEALNRNVRRLAEFRIRVVNLLLEP